VGILRVSVEQQVRIDAVGAKLHLTIAGSSALVGGVALRKAAEVRELVVVLADHGVEEADLSVVGLRASTAGGWVNKSQKVSIQIQVRVAVDQLGPVLGILTNRSGVQLDQVEWVYDEFEASIAAVAEAMTKARRKADALAAAAGQRITGIAEISDSWSRYSPPMPLGGMRTMSAVAKAEPELDLGFELSGSTELNVHLSVDYQIGD
jgi:uncharacterized protein YggE